MLAAAAVRKKRTERVESIAKPQFIRREYFCPRTIPNYKYKVDLRITIIKIWYLKILDRK